MGSQRDTFGTLTPLRGEARDDRCVVRDCRAVPRHERSGITTSYGLCDRHVDDWDAGRVAGSLVRGYTVEVT